MRAAQRARQLLVWYAGAQVQQLLEQVGVGTLQLLQGQRGGGGGQGRGGRGFSWAQARPGRKAAGLKGGWGSVRRQQQQQQQQPAGASWKGWPAPGAWRCKHRCRRQHRGAGARPPAPPPTPTPSQPPPRTCTISISRPHWRQSSVHCASSLLHPSQEPSSAASCWKRDSVSTMSSASTSMSWSDWSDSCWLLKASGSPPSSSRSTRPRCTFSESISLFTESHLPKGPS
jgi:hypothetical protein